jgi:hypothetical protein
MPLHIKTKHWSPIVDWLVVFIHVRMYRYTFICRYIRSTKCRKILDWPVVFIHVPMKVHTFHIVPQNFRLACTCMYVHVVYVHAYDWKHANVSKNSYTSSWSYKSVKTGSWGRSICSWIVSIYCHMQMMIATQLLISRMYVGPTLGPKERHFYK